MGQLHPQFSIIIPTYHSHKLDQTLKAIAELNELESVQDVFVVGQQEPFDAHNIPGLRYIEVIDSPTPACNRNIGVQTARSEWVCFTDSDCRPSQNWLLQLRKAIQADSVAIAGAVSIPADMPYWGTCDHLFGFEWQASEISQSGEIPYAATLNFCVRRDVFTTLGGFDENFTTPGGEDREFGWRLEQAGYTIKNVPDAWVIHDHIRKDFPSAWQHIYHYGCVTAHFRQKYANMNSYSWQVFNRAARIPIFGESMGIIRVLLRNLVRLFKKPGYLRLIRFIPGIIILDIAHTLGTIQTLRSIR